MAFTIEDLQIEFESNDTSAAISGIDALARSLERLKKAVGGDLNGASSNMNRIAAAMRNLKGIGELNLAPNVSQLKSLAGVAEKLAGINGAAFESNMTAITRSLGSATAVQKGDFSAITNSVSKLTETIAGMNSADLRQFSNRMNTVVSSLSYLDTVKNGNFGSVVNQLKKLPEVASGLNSVNFDNFATQMEKVASGMSKLKGIESGKLGTVVNQLKKIPEITQALDPVTLDQFASAIQRLVQAVAPLASQMDSVARGFSMLPTRMQAAIAASNRVVTANHSMSGSYAALSTSITRTITKFTVLGFAFRRVWSVFAGAYNISNDYVETLNLFSVAMGDAAVEARKYAQTVQDLVGIDMAEWMNNQSVFMQTLTGFGIASDEAAQMSKTLTQLGYDIASLWNADTDLVMQRLESAMTGQIKGMKNYGYNVSVAALQETALALGIDQSVRSMTEAQKAQLRYITIMRNANGTMGDMAKTLTTPANAMRVLNSQMERMKRAFGDIVSVLVTQLIPYVQAFVELMTEAANALAKVFGFQITELPSSALESAGGFADDLESANDTAKELKRQLLGFDELNVLSSNASDTLAGASNSLGLDMSEYDYDFLAGLDGKVDAIKERMKGILEVALAVGGAFLAWKLASGFLTGLERMDKLLAGITKMGPVTLLNKGTMALLPQLITGIALAGGLILTAWQNSENFREGCKALWETAKNAFKGIAEVTGDVVKALDLPELDGEAFTTFASGAVMAIGMIATALGAPLLGGIAAFAGAGVFAIQSIGEAAKSEYTGMEDIGINLGSALASGLAIGLAALVVGTGPVGAAVAGVATAAIAFGAAMSTDAVQGVEIFNDTITEATREKVEPFLNKMRELSDALVTLEYTGQIIDDAVVTDVASKMSSIKELISAELDADQSSANNMLGSLQGFMTAEDYAELLAANEGYYAQAKENLTAYESEVNAIMQNASLENRAITEAEWGEIYRIQSEMQNLGVSTLSESAIEYETIMRNLKDNTTRVSLEQASEIIKNAQDTRDEAIAAAEKQYSTVVLEAKRMLEAGVINEEQYQNIIDAAKEAKDSTIADAKEQYQSIYDTTTSKLGETARFIDSETGEIKTKWQVFTEDLSVWWNETWDNAAVRWNMFTSELSASWDTYKENFSRNWNEFWTGVGETCAGAINGVISAVEKGINWVIDKLNSLDFTVPDWVPMLGGKQFGFDIPKVALGRVSFSGAYAEGGFPTTGSMFIARESGPELVGRIGSKTAVGNNDQIIAGIRSGVHDANQDLISAAYAVGTQIITAIRENGGDVYLDSEKLSSRVTSVQKQHDKMYGTA